MINEEEFQAITRGNEQAFEAVFNRYYKTLVSFSIRHGLEQMDAEDIVIESFHNVWSLRESLASPSALHTLLYTSVRNRSLNVYRNLSNRKRIIGDLPPEEEYETSPEYLVAGYPAFPEQMIKERYTRQQVLPFLKA